MSSNTRVLPSDDILGLEVCEQSDGGTLVQGPFSTAAKLCAALQATIVGADGGGVPSMVSVSAPTDAPSGRSNLSPATACDVAGAPLTGNAGAEPLPLDPCTNRSPAGTSGGAGGVGVPLPTLAALPQAAMSGAWALAAGATNSATTAALPTAASATAAVRRERRDCRGFIGLPPSSCACAASDRHCGRSRPHRSPGRTRSPARHRELAAACLRR